MAGSDQLVARVAVAVGLAHLDRPFEYSVPADQREAVGVGCRVSVRFSGRLVSGFVLGLARASTHPGPLQPLHRVVSPEPVLSPPVARLARTVADQYAGTLADVLRLAVPPRHARIEREPPPPSLPPPHTSGNRGAGGTAWERAAGGPELLEALRAGVTTRVAWTALPGDDWPAALAAASVACMRAGRGAVLCLPDRRDVARVDAALTSALGGPGRHVALTSDLGPAPRYRAFLSVLRGQVQVVVGTRAAAFAPVRRPGLLVVWDDGDDLHAEPRAPYPHVREVLTMRAHQQRAGLLLAGHARTPEAQRLVESGWLAAVAAPRPVVRAAWPRVTVTGAYPDRLPPAAMRAVRSGLTRGPVLVQVPRTGYRTRLVCQDCRTPTECPVCTGPLEQIGRGRAPTCRWCGRVETAWSCSTCGGRRLRAPVVGADRTEEELGRAFPGIAVRHSAGEAVLDTITTRAIVVATPGAEPGSTDGYAAAVLLDTGLALARADLRAGEESVRRWLAVAALVRPASRGGELVVAGEDGSPAVQALVRADPAGYAERELAARASARMPPAVRLATIEGPLDVLRSLTDRAVVAALTGSAWPVPADLLGPVETGPARGRLVVRVPWASRRAFSRTLAALQSARSVRKAEPLRVVVDPAELG